MSSVLLCDVISENTRITHGEHNCTAPLVTWTCMLLSILMQCLQHCMSILLHRICYMYTHLLGRLALTCTLSFTEQYDSFVKFSHDQVERRLAESAFSCEFISVIIS